MQRNMFAEETRLQRLSKLGDFLEKLKIIDFEAFHPLLDNSFRKERRSNTGRPPFIDVFTVKRIFTHIGTIVNATFENSLRLRNAPYESKQIKNGEMPFLNEVCMGNYVHLRNSPDIRG